MQILQAELKTIKGKVQAIPSKSMAHRKMIAAALSEKPMALAFESNDIQATKNCLAALMNGKSRFPCGESGSTFRFLLPLAGALGAKGNFVMEGRLGQRPIEALVAVLKAHGMQIEWVSENEMAVSGRLQPGEYLIRGDISSQYLSGLLFALPLLDGESQIKVQGGIASRPYVDLTLSVLAESRIQIGQEFKIPGNQTYVLEDTTVEGDWSNAAFWLCAGALLDEGLTVTGLNLASEQGDRQVLSLLEAFGAKVMVSKEDDSAIHVSKAVLKGITIDAEDVPDLVPILALVAAVAEGETHIFNAGRLRLKESDRLENTQKILNQLGAQVTTTNDSLTIKGANGVLKGTEVVLEGCNDHRMVMMLAVASIVCEKPVRILGPQAVNKSYPEFFEEVRRLGGIITE